jgi:hypothetical protein
MRPTGLMASWLLVWLLVGVAGTAAQEATSGAVEQQSCNSHGDLLAILKQTYTEEPNALGLQSNGHLLEVFVSKRTGSWTIVSTRPDGISCIVAAGRHWQSVPQTPDEPIV